MKAKLIKKEEEFSLCIPHKGTNQFIASTDGMYVEYTLSLKNCQAIELGYDLDELACNEIKIDISVVKHIDEKLKENSSPCTPLNEGGCVGSNLYNQVKGFQKGFQKALEILGDKKFSEENLLKAFTVGLFSEFEKANYTKEYDDFLKSLQQTEWEVTFNPDEKDVDGCLILKRIK